ncbi:MAG TPA: YdaS family helix-turn-helix protein [Roseococcus sp.]|jgi:DNA-binding transcriptional regulator YdaS (Cro superfamily)|nr:YdaS family helix-turn-helix protein [Roseococcus sp.]
MDISRIIEAGGGVAKLARALNLKHTSIIGWKRRGVIPAERVAEVAAATGLHPAEIRKDLAAAFNAQPPEAA